MIELASASLHALGIEVPAQGETAIRCFGIVGSFNAGVGRFPSTRLCQASGIRDFKIHDLRRTAASLMAGAGVGRLTIAKILNHKEATVTSIYDRWGYGPEIQNALEKWGRRLDKILDGVDETDDDLG